jgi:DNA polymerase I-like protein with 3'-5' exonuclease and polymerase domains
MHYKMIDTGMKPLFKSLEETGILLDEEKLITLIRGSQKRLARQKQEINREAGFIVNLYSDGHWNRTVQEIESEFILRKLLEARTLSSLIRKLQQIYDLANGNFRALNRLFGLYSKYGLDINGKITTVGELSVEELPKEVLEAVSRQGEIIIKATYSSIISSVVQKLSDDSQVNVESFIHSLAKSQGIVSSFFGRRAKVPKIESERLRFVVEFPIESTAMDLAKIGFINLFEDYRIGNLGSQIFAIAPYSVYLFAPEKQADSILLICRECLENAHCDFALTVDVTMGSSLIELM